MTYGDYLELDALLDLQNPRSDPPEHDEMLFIVIHQAYELWFKLLLHEVDRVQRQFSDDDLFGAIATFKRMRMVIKTLVGQVDILETMTPMSFESFRDRLDRASGFQSVQFREVEFALGYKRPQMVDYHPEGSPARAALERRLNAPTVIDHFYRLLTARGISVPQRLLDREPSLPAEPNDEVQDGLVEAYREQPDLAILLELMTDFDEGLQEWRYRHVKMVERTIGNKHGTGGSLGVRFLRDTLFNPIFPDLWAVRHRF